MSTEPQQPKFEPPPKDYLGDSVYIEFDGNCAVITTNNGYPDDPRNRIAIEPEVWVKMQRWMKQFEDAATEWRRRRS